MIKYNVALAEQLKKNIPTNRLVVASSEYNQGIFGLLSNMANWFQKKSNSFTKKQYIAHSFNLFWKDGELLCLESDSKRGMIINNFWTSNTVKKMKGGNIHFHILPLDFNGEHFDKFIKKVFGIKYDLNRAIASLKSLYRIMKFFGYKKKSSKEMFCSEAVLESIRFMNKEKYNPLEELKFKKVDSESLHPRALFDILYPSYPKITIKIKNHKFVDFIFNNFEK